jgi:hypothetical protein
MMVATGMAANDFAANSRFNHWLQPHRRWLHVTVGAGRRALTILRV